jgi:hypothetical protein
VYVSAGASPPEDPSPPLLELDPSMDVSIVIGPSPVAGASPDVASIVGSMTPVSGAFGGGAAVSFPFVVSLGTAQYWTPLASWAHTRPEIPSTLQSPSTMQRLRQR